MRGMGLFTTRLLAVPEVGEGMCSANSLKPSAAPFHRVHASPPPPAKPTGGSNSQLNDIQTITGLTQVLSQTLAAQQQYNRNQHLPTLEIEKFEGDSLSLCDSATPSLGLWKPTQMIHREDSPTYTTI